MNANNELHVYGEGTDWYAFGGISVPSTRPSWVPSTARITDVELAVGDQRGTYAGVRLLAWVWEFEGRRYAVPGASAYPPVILPKWVADAIATGAADTSGDTRP